MLSTVSTCTVSTCTVSTCTVSTCTVALPTPFGPMACADSTWARVRRAGDVADRRVGTVADRRVGTVADRRVGTVADHDVAARRCRATGTIRRLGGTVAVACPSVRRASTGGIRPAHHTFVRPLPSVQPTEEST